VARSTIVCTVNTKQWRTMTKELNGNGNGNSAMTQKQSSATNEKRD